MEPCSTVAAAEFAVREAATRLVLQLSLLVGAHIPKRIGLAASQAQARSSPLTVDERDPLPRLAPAAAAESDEREIGQRLVGRFPTHLECCVRMYARREIVLGPNAHA
jgi:hypothetical protein